MKRKNIRKVAFLGFGVLFGIIIIFAITNSLFGEWAEANLIGTSAGFIICIIALISGLIGISALYLLFILPPGKSKRNKRSK